MPSQPCSFVCPSNHPRLSDSQFDSYNVSKSIWCSSCKGCHASTAWQCPCKLAWHKCPIHFSFPAHTMQRPNLSRTRGTKRPAPVSASQSATLLRRLEPDIPSRACLGPRLAARFPHLANGNARQQQMQHDGSTAPGPHLETGPGAQHPT